jgi:putative oxidoreductase
MKAPFLLGRLVFGGFFLYNGIHHFKQSKLLGVKPKLGTLAILGFLAGVTPVMHDFWKQEDPQMRQNDMINFTKNMAMAGAALALFGVEEPWEASIPIAQPKGMDRVRAIGRRLRAA